MQLDIQFNPSVEPWQQLRDGVLCAEEAGFGTAWVFDHYAGSMLGGTTMLECFTLLGAMAVATERIGLGSLVANTVNRNAGLLATSAASVQHLSSGRFILGVGAGTSPNSTWAAEHLDLGLPLGRTLAERHARFAAMLDELDRIWTPGAEGVAATYPRPDPRPPVIVGVNSVALARLAGSRCDGVNVRASHPDIDALLDAALEARDAAGRAEAPWMTTVWTRFDERLGDPNDPQRQRWERRGVDRLILTVLDPHDPKAIERTLRD